MLTLLLEKFNVKLLNILVAKRILFNLYQQNENKCTKLQELRLGTLSASSREYLQRRIVSPEILQQIRSLPPNLTNTNKIA